MSNSNNNHDAFAAIATRRPAQQTNLMEPPPPPRPERHLPIAPQLARAARFQPQPRMQTAAALTTGLKTSRERFKPFLRDLVPALEQLRVIQPIETFQWRVESDRDRMDFANVLAGGGAWETVRIPHYGEPLGRAVTYYRTTFDVTPQMRARDRLFICFNGVDYKAHVFINGSFLGSHEGFFAPFEFEFTAHAKQGDNVLVVKVENDAICGGNNPWGTEKGLEGDKIYAATGPGYDDPEIGWHHCPPGMGIYQGVRVETRSRLFINDIFVRPLLAETDQKMTGSDDHSGAGQGSGQGLSQDSHAKAEAWVELWNCDIHGSPARLQLSVYGQNFECTVCEDREHELCGTLGPRVNYFRLQMDVPDCRIWEPEAPWLYQLQVKLLDKDGELLDTARKQFGMRSFVMDTENEPRGRMFLNGREIRLRGANTMGFEQQDVMKQDWEQLIDDILLAKLCNMNFWRLTQRPVQPEVYEYCDRLGLMTQTDLPLFGMLRRNQFCEAVRQAEEMERLVRSHPCNIMVTYINEPFPNGRDNPHRHLLRHELENFFQAADLAVWQANPDRVIKAVDGDYDPPGPGLPDNHCYCGWYNGHGLDLGKLHRGYWQRVKPGWMYGCGEFGSEGLEDVALMRRTYPQEWLPQTPEEEHDWFPDRIVRAQSGRFHYMWFDTQHKLEDWVRVSQAHQEWTVRLMTEAFRRNRRMNTFAVHLFIDAFPSGWMKTIMDVDRRPKPAFFAYRDALTPLMTNLRTDRFAYFDGEQAELEAWVCNDTHDTVNDAKLAYRLEINGQACSGGCTEIDVPVCDSSCAGLLRFDLPQVESRTTATVRLALLDANSEVVHDTSLALTLHPRPAESDSKRVVTLLGDTADTGAAATLARALGIAPVYVNESDVENSIVHPATTTLVIDDMSKYKRHQAAADKLVKNGATVVFLELPEGEHDIGGSKVTVAKCGMRPMHFVSRATGHPMVADFAPDDFKFWYDARLGYPSPLLESNFSGDGWTPILASGNGGWDQGWTTVMAAAERPAGKGRWRICNVTLAGRTPVNPVAEIFARRLLGWVKVGWNRQEGQASVLTKRCQTKKMSIRP